MRKLREMITICDNRATVGMKGMNEWAKFLQECKDCEMSP